MIENYLNAIDEDDGDADEDRGDHMTLLSCFQEFCLLWPSCFEHYLRFCSPQIEVYKDALLIAS